MFSFGRGGIAAFGRALSTDDLIAQLLQSQSPNQSPSTHRVGAKSRVRKVFHRPPNPSFRRAMWMHRRIGIEMLSWSPRNDVPRAHARGWYDVKVPVEERQPRAHPTRNISIPTSVDGRCVESRSRSGRHIRHSCRVNAQPLPQEFNRTASRTAHVHRCCYALLPNTNSLSPSIHCALTSNTNISSAVQVSTNRFLQP